MVFAVARSILGSLPLHCQRRCASQLIEPQWASRFEEVKQAKAEGTALLKEIVSMLPKAELHVHLDGSLRSSTLVKLFNESEGRDTLPPIPTVTVPGADEMSPPVEKAGPELLKTYYSDLEDYLRVFAYSVTALQTSRALTQAAFEFILDHAADGIRYVEVRFAPQLHMNGPNSCTADLSNASDYDSRFEEVLLAVNEGLRRGCEAVNGYTVEGQLPMRYGIIVCGLRSIVTDSGAPINSYYGDVIAATPRTASVSPAVFASLRLVHDKREFLRRHPDVPLVGVDLAGAEFGNCVRDYKPAYEIAHEELWGRTVHAGEADGLHSVLNAIRSCGAHRIGHGYHLFSPDRVTPATLQTLHCQTPEQAIDKVVKYIANHRIHIEVCLTSNEQTMPHLRGNLGQHTFRRMLESNLSVGLCTDNTLVSSTTLTKEYLRAIEHFDLDLEQLVHLIMTSHAASFFPGSQREKLQYLELASNNVKAVLEHYLAPLPY